MDNDQYITLKQGDEIIQEKYTITDLKKIEHKLWWADTMGLILVAAVALFLIIPNFKITYTATGSMVPTISVGDLALYGPVGKAIERGDIIMFVPVGPTTEKASILTGTTVYYEKRVIGLPGERIRIEDGVVYINNTPLEEPYKVFSAQNHWRNMDEMIIPDGCYFVMGDNRDNSNDSRVFGVVPYDNIRFKVILIVPSLAGILTGADNDELFIESGHGVF